MKSYLKNNGIVKVAVVMIINEVKKVKIKISSFVGIELVQILVHNRRYL